MSWSETQSASSRNPPLSRGLRQMFRQLQEQPSRLRAARWQALHFVENFLDHRVLDFVLPAAMLFHAPLKKIRRPGAVDSNRHVRPPFVFDRLEPEPFC